VAKTYVHGVARRFLTHYSADWKIVCGLCTEVPSLENGKAKIVDRPGGGKGIAVTFTLKPGLKWADGAPLTTKDIAFSLEAGKRADLGFNNPDLYDAMEKIDVVDASTFVIHFNKIRYDFDSLADFTILPEHIEGPIYRAVTDPKEYGRNSAFNRAPTTAGLYNGPYRITQVETGQFIRFERNEHWIGERPAFDRIIIRTIENTSALEQNLLSGDVDYVAGELGLSFDQALALQKRASDKFNFVFESSLIYEHIDLNLDNPALADKRVRQALLMAIDRETLVQKLFEGRQPVAHSWVHPKDAGYDPNVKKYPFDPAAARKLLEEAGFRPAAGGIRQNSAGVKLSFEFVTTAGNKVRELVQQVLQSQFKDVGVEVVIKNEPARSYFGQTLKERRYTGLAMYAWSSSPQNPPVVTLRSDNIPSQTNNFAGSNYPGFRNAEMDRLINATQAELDPAVRKGYWTRMQAIYTEEAPVLPLYFRADPFVIPKWLTGVKPTGNSVPSTFTIEYWRTR
jgi:peptide/nickel transport system substrate-binding protein